MSSASSSETLSSPLLHLPALEEDGPDATAILSPFERIRAVQSSALLQEHKAVPIVHNGTVYRLQATKLGKLILTK